MLLTYRFNNGAEFEIFVEASLCMEKLLIATAQRALLQLIYFQFFFIDCVCPLIQRNLFTCQPQLLVDELHYAFFRLHAYNKREVKIFRHYLP